MSAVAMSAANLSIIEDNLQALANNMGVVSQSVHTVNGHINEVEGQMQNVRANVKSLEEEIKAFMLEIRQGTIVSNSRQSILMDQAEIEKKFGHYDDVRRKINGILQSADINAIRKSTIENISEQTIINTPNYWLAPALVALCAWYTNDKDLANRALKEAMNRDDEKTSLLFCLIHLRANRTNTSIKWLERYLSMQNPLEMDNKVITVLDAISLGVFGNESKKMCLEYINNWINQLKTRPNLKDVQIEKWKNYFEDKLEKINEDDFPYLVKYVPEWNRIENILSISYINEPLFNDFKTILNQSTYNHTSTINKLDKLVTSLVFNYEKEELELRKSISKNKHIIEENGDVKSALKKWEQTSTIFDEKKDFNTHISNISIGNNSIDCSLNTKKMAISLAKEFIVEAYKKIAYINYNDVLPTITIRINEWEGTTENGSNEKDLQTSLAGFLEKELHDEVYSDKPFNLKMLIGTFVGIVLMIFTYKNIMLATIIFCITLLFNGFHLVVNLNKRDKKIKQLNEIKNKHSNLLLNIIAEVVDYQKIWRDSKKDRDSLISYLNSLNYENYITNNENIVRKIIIGGNNNE